MAYIIDADWVIEALSGEPHAEIPLRRLIGARIAISWVTVAEIYEGAFSSVNPEHEFVRMRHFISRFALLNIDDRTAVTFAELRRHLRRRGELIPDMDLFVAATALAHDLTLLTFNVRHFGRIPSLRIYQSV